VALKDRLGRFNQGVPIFLISIGGFIDRAVERETPSGRVGPTGYGSREGLPSSSRFCRALIGAGLC
jgi:hypothetical protein